MNPAVSDSPQRGRLAWRKKEATSLGKSARIKQAKQLPDWVFQASPWPSCRTGHRAQFGARPGLPARVSVRGTAAWTPAPRLVTLPRTERRTGSPAPASPALLSVAVRVKPRLGAQTQNWRWAAASLCCVALRTSVTNRMSGILCMPTFGVMSFWITDGSPGAFSDLRRAAFAISGRRAPRDPAKPAP